MDSLANLSQFIRCFHLLTIQRVLISIRSQESIVFEYLKLFGERLHSEAVLFLVEHQDMSRLNVVKLGNITVKSEVRLQHQY